MNKVVQWCVSGAQYYLKALKNYAVFRGRARRREYWLFALCHMIGFYVMLTISAVLDIYIYEAPIGAGGGVKIYLLDQIWVVAHVVPYAAISVRRLHDTGRSGWWLFWFNLIAWPMLALVMYNAFSSMARLSASEYVMDRTAALVSLGALMASVVSIVASIWFLVIMVKDSQPGENRYGPNPKGVLAVAATEPALDAQSESDS